jgi:hypothetical protein
MTLAMTAASAQQKPTTGYAPVNGLKMYYEVHGVGEPVVLLHGAFMTITNNWDGWIGELSKTRKVIAVEMQGHGRTADIPRDITHLVAVARTATMSAMDRTQRAEQMHRLLERRERVGLKLVDVQDAEVVDQPAQPGSDVGAVSGSGAGGEVGGVGVEDVAKGTRISADVIEVDAEDGEDLAGGGEGLVVHGHTSGSDGRRRARAIAQQIGPMRTCSTQTPTLAIPRPASTGSQ